MRHVYVLGSRTDHHEPFTQDGSNSNQKVVPKLPGYLASSWCICIGVRLISRSSSWYPLFCRASDRTLSNPDVYRARAPYGRRQNDEIALPRSGSARISRQIHKTKSPGSGKGLVSIARRSWLKGFLQFERCPLADSSRWRGWFDAARLACNALAERSLEREAM